MLPAYQPSREISSRLLRIAPIVQPAQFNQAFIGDSRQVVQCIAQKMHIAALPIRLWEHFGNRALEAGMIVADGEDNAAQTAPLQAEKEFFPAR